MPYVGWIGEPDPYEQNPERIRALIKAGTLTREQVWAFNRDRAIALPWGSARILGPEEGLSKFYQWGPEPQSFTQLVADADWRRIQSLAEAKQFVLVDGR